MSALTVAQRTFVVSIGGPFPSQAALYSTLVGFSQRPPTLVKVSRGTTTGLYSKQRIETLQLTRGAPPNLQGSPSQ